MSDDAKFGCGIAIAIPVLVALMVVAALWLKGEQCAARWSDYEHQWEFLSGCRVKIDGRWVPADRIREIPA